MESADRSAPETTSPSVVQPGDAEDVHAPAPTSEDHG